MTGLRRYTRDLSLPVEYGDADLVAPDRDTLAEWVRDQLVLPGGPAVLGAEVGHARYKPGIGVSVTYDVQLEGEVWVPVTYRAHRGSKAGGLVVDVDGDRHLEESELALRPGIQVPGRDAVLRVFPADRVLRGAPRATHMRRLARLVDEGGCHPERVVRMRASRLTLLRYKPERRAVLRFDAKLRGPQGQRTEKVYGVRVLEPAIARVVARRRQRLEAALGSDWMPRLLVQDDRAGILVEEWLPGKSLDEPGGRLEPAMAGILARLHSVPAATTRHSDPPTYVHCDPLFQVRAHLVELARGIQPVSIDKRCCWVHGDFHADQWLRGPGGWSLLDLDCLRGGVPEEDLASWIVDRIAAGQVDRPADRIAETVEVYRANGGGAVHMDIVAGLLARGLQERAAASLRRLELGAVERAQHLLQLAHAVSGGRPTGGRR